VPKPSPFLGLRRSRSHGGAKEEETPYPDWAGLDENLLLRLFELVAAIPDGCEVVRLCACHASSLPLASAARSTGSLLWRTRRRVHLSACLLLSA